MASGFPPTRHSVIDRLRKNDALERRTAFGDLVGGYWKPVYKHLRATWRFTPEDAQDGTQAFFAEAFQKAWLEKYEPDKARFRTFVRVCVDRFVMNARQSSARMKRGGAIQLIALDFAGAEQEVAARPSRAPEDPDAFFRHEFVRALFQRAVGAVRDDMLATGRRLHFELFRRYDLAPDREVSYAGLAREFALTEAQVTNHLALVRRQFRTHALVALRGLCGTDEEFRREARDLFGMEVE